MADYEDGIFSNLPRRGRRADDDDNTRSFFREALGMYVPEGPLPERPRPSGKGGPSLGADGKPIMPGGGTSVWSAADATANGMTLSNGGLTVTPTGANVNQSVRGTISHSAGKYYVEFLSVIVASNSFQILGLADTTFNPVDYLGHNGVSVGVSLQTASYTTSGFTVNYTPPAGVVPIANDVFAIAIDFVAGKVWLAKNNVWLNGGVPSSGTNPFITITAPALGVALFPGMTLYGAGGVWTLQSTAASQKYAPPSGFSAWDGGVAPPPTSVWSAADATTNSMTLSNGGLTVTPSLSSWETVRNTISKTSGKLYVEFYMLSGPSGNFEILGLASSGFNSGNYLGSSVYSVGIYPSTSILVSSGFTANLPTPSVVPSAGDVWALAIDFAAGSIWAAQNNVWSQGGNPGTGASPIVSFVPATVGALFAAMSLQLPATSWTLQSTAASQKYAPPSGFSAWDAAAAPSAGLGTGFTLGVTPIG